MTLSAQEKLAQLHRQITNAQTVTPNIAAKTVTLIAVGKTFEADAIVPFIEAGVTDFGENRVQEAQQKWPALKARYPHIVLHLIGPLQRNKVRAAVELFDVIHTVDRLKLLDALSNEMAKTGRRLPLLIQVNISQEPQKSGIALEDADGFIETVKNDYDVELTGLMGIAKQGEDPAPYFALLRQIAKRHGLPHLSMGMSHDYESAIRFGATHIRVGTALFGKRSQ